jgi:Ca2+-transporting ATPase
LPYRHAKTVVVAIKDGGVLFGEVLAADVVPGDVLVLAPGDAIAADARVLIAHRLSVNEAALTGESLPVRKEPADRLPPAAPLAERRNMVHMGTVVSGGRGTAGVVPTGERTVLGGIRTLSEGGGYTPRPPMMYARAEMAADSAGATPVAAGELTVRIDINGVFDLNR